MAEGFVTAGANTALNALAAAYPWIKPHVGAPGAAGTANPAGETTRKQATWAGASGGSVASSASLTWTGVSTSEDWTHFSAWSLETGGACGFTGGFTANPLVAGDTMTVASGAVTVSVPLAT